MRNHPARPHAQPPSPANPFQRFPTPSKSDRTQTPRPDRETAKITHRAASNPYTTAAAPNVYSALTPPAA